MTAKIISGRGFIPSTITAGALTTIYPQHVTGDMGGNAGIRAGLGCNDINGGDTGPGLQHVQQTKRRPSKTGMTALFIFLQLSIGRIKTISRAKYCFDIKVSYMLPQKEN